MIHKGFGRNYSQNARLFGNIQKLIRNYFLLKIITTNKHNTISKNNIEEKKRILELQKGNLNEIYIFIKHKDENKKREKNL